LHKGLDKVKGDMLSDKILYIQADHFQVGKKTLYEIAEDFVTLGGKWIAFDEIHKYPDWAKEDLTVTVQEAKMQVVDDGSY
ncbi:hypothetical protein LCGC14_0873290, partial [marine sediment metagenome]